MPLQSIKRYLEQPIIDDALAKNKMAFISGPRQCGKSVLARHILATKGQDENYFTWDDEEFRRLWIRNPKLILEKLKTPHQQKMLLVLDELHKQRIWKRSLKGLYDLFFEKMSFIVTGSARLDIFRKGGDSLQGRYFPYRLHPFTLGEINTIKPPPSEDWFENTSMTFPLESLLQLGGFPEPLLSGSESEVSRWRRLRRERLIREDIRDLRSIHDLQNIENLVLLLDDVAGSSLSFESLREDLHVSFATVKDWVGVLSALYYCFLIRPYSKNVRRSLHKEPKLYLYDWSGLRNAGARLENLIACHLLKACHAWTDTAFGEYNLYYVRDREKREVDFLITNNEKPYALIEVKSNETDASSNLRYFTEILKPKFSFQLVLNKNFEKRIVVTRPEIHIIEISRFLSALD